MSELPVGEVLRGLSVGALPDEWTPVEAMIMVKCLDQDGGSQWAWRATSAISNREVVGALVVQLQIARQQAVEEFE